ncbi:MAG: hypothetical protein P9L97_05915 [Candidatus Tenebribacter davisii]|nr:hypothetical protein [Candidatus Tenebribacter davisii]
MSDIRIPSMLLICIGNSRGMECFPLINMWSISRKRQWRDKPESEKEAHRQKMREVMPGVRRKYMKTITAKQKKVFAKMMSDGKKKYWANISEEDKKIHIAKMAAGIKVARENNRYPKNTFTPEKARRTLHGIKEVIELPRVNTYSGTITMSEMENLNA